LEVAKASFNHGTRFNAIAGQSGNGIRRKVVENGKSVFCRWPDVDVGLACIVGLEEREP
jgi:hypothetical protein